MKITSYVDLTPAQEDVLGALQTVTVRTSLTKPTVVATIRTGYGQDIEITIDADGEITDIEAHRESL